jgi:hypothetical protein
VVVGERDAVHAPGGQQLRGARWSAEEERLARCAPALAALGDAALEVDDEQVGGPGQRDQLRVDQRLAPARDRLGDAAPEHRVACEREPHAPVSGLPRRGARTGGSSRLRSPPHRSRNVIAPVRRVR